MCEQARIYKRDLNKFRFSLSHELDKLRGIKLSELRMIYNKNQNSETAFSQSSKEIRFEIKEVPVGNEIAISKSVLSFKNDRMQ